MTATNGDPRFLAALDEIRELHLRKARDYGRADDPLANVSSAEAFGVPGWLGAMLRANDKIHRLRQYAVSGFLANEGVEDSLMDLACYALIGLVLFREGQHRHDRGALH